MQRPHTAGMLSARGSHTQAPRLTDMDRLSDHAAPALEAAAREVMAGQPCLPLPGRGHPLARWRELAAIAGLSDAERTKVLHDNGSRLFADRLRT